MVVDLVDTKDVQMESCLVGSKDALKAAQTGLLMAVSRDDC